MSCILQNYGHTRSQGGRQLAAAKQRWYIRTTYLLLYDVDTCSINPYATAAVYILVAYIITRGYYLQHGGVTDRATARPTTRPKCANNYKPRDEIERPSDRPAATDRLGDPARRETKHSHLCGPELPFILDSHHPDTNVRYRYMLSHSRTT